MKEPRPIFATLAEEQNKRRRALLSLDVLIDARRAVDPVGAAVALTTTTTIMPCPTGYFKEGRGMGVCKSCPAGTSTTNITSNDIRMCLCLPGWYRLLTTTTTANSSNVRPCSPCLENSFRSINIISSSASLSSSSPFQEEVCTSCPPNETTHGRIGSTACSCIPGFIRKNGTCVPCEAGTYCTPCFEGEDLCPLSGVQVTACFQNATSPPGSTSITQCTCLSGLVPLQRTTTTHNHYYQNYYCAPVPPMAIYDPLTKKVGCKTGWTAQWDVMGQLVGCQLCPMGSYALFDPSSSSSSSNNNNICKICPKGTFSAFTDMIGGCTPCPYPQTTEAEGATSPESCGCPAPTRKVGDNQCEGCLSNQYLGTGGVCLPCPAFSISNVGAVSLLDCKCMAGYFFQDKTLSCQICPVGTYSSHATDSGCKPCPKGSTTAGLGSKSVRECGATKELCLSGYSWRGVYLGCAPSSSVVA